VIGERVRDKIAASKAKGIWVGGAVPLGYASVNKKLVVVPEDAEMVRGAQGWHVRQRGGGFPSPVDSFIILLLF
jgi:hypothetical protein